MVDVATVDAKKDQVAGRQRVDRNRSGCVPLRVSRAWNLRSRALVGIHGESTAVEALQIGATEMIRNTDELRSGASNRYPTISSRLLRLGGNSAACNEQQRYGDRECIAQAPNLTRAPRRVIGSAGSADVAHLRTRAHCAGLQQFCHCLPREWSGEEEALRNITATLTQEIELLYCLDSLRDHTLT
jgi:hypothetical protein